MRAPILAIPPVVLGLAGEFIIIDLSVALSSSFELSVKPKKVFFRSLRYDSSFFSSDLLLTG